MIRELTENYNPKEVIHREEQMQKIKDFFEIFKRDGFVAGNLIIMGVTGAGKTLVVNKIIEEENNTLYVSGASIKTSFKTLKALFDLKVNTQERLIHDAIESLKKQPRAIVIDEINKISDIVCLFDNLNTIYRATQCPMILITNKRTIFSDMPEDAKKTLFFEKIEFPSYDAIELFDILKNRLDITGTKVPESAMRLICAISAREGSARVMLSLASQCISKKDYSEDFILSLMKNMQEEDWIYFVKGLMDVEREFLNVLLELATKHKTFSSSDIQKVMKDRSCARISQLITKFKEEYGVIKTEYKNLGRKGGRTRIIKFSSEDIYKRLDKIV